MLLPIAVQYLSGCVNLIGMLPTVFDLLFVCKLSKIRRIDQNVLKLVDVIANVGNQMDLKKVEIRFHMFQLHTLGVLFFTVCVALLSTLSLCD